MHNMYISEPLFLENVFDALSFEMLFFFMQMIDSDKKFLPEGEIFQRAYMYIYFELHLHYLEDSEQLLGDRSNIEL